MNDKGRYHAYAEERCRGRKHLRFQIVTSCLSVSTGLKSVHFRRFSGIQFGIRTPLG